MLRPSVSERVIVAGLLAVHGTLTWLQRAPGMTTMQDDASYMLLARSLRAGRYVDSFLVGNPPQTQYPPGYPAILGLLGALFGESYGLFLAWNVVALVSALALCYWLVRRRWPAWFAVSVTALLAASPLTIVNASRVLTEPTFLLAFMLLLWSLEEQRSSPIRTVVAPLLAVASFLVRTAGTPFVVGLAAYWALRRDWRRAAIACALMLVPVGGWIAWTYRAQRQTIAENYWTPVTSADPPLQRPESTLAATRVVAPPRFRTVPRTPLVIINVKSYLIDGVPSATAMPLVRGTPIDNVIWLLITLVGLPFGAVALWRRWRSAAVLTGSYLGMLAIWVWNGPRLLLPILPILFVTLLAGWEVISRRLVRRPALLPLALALVLGVSALAQVRGRLADVRGCDAGLQSSPRSCSTPDQVGLFQAADELRRRSRPDEHAVVAKPQTFGYLTGLRFVPVLPVAGRTAGDVLARFHRYGVHYAFLSHLSSYDETLARLLSAVCDSLDLVATYPGDSYLYRLRDSTSTPGAGPACGSLNARQPDSTYQALQIRW
jgi:hypothetical protein